VDGDDTDAREETEITQRSTFDTIGGYGHFAAHLFAADDHATRLIAATTDAYLRDEAEAGSTRTAPAISSRWTGLRSILRFDERFRPQARLAR
jgi:hypothetical protein